MLKLDNLKYGIIRDCVVNHIFCLVCRAQITLAEFFAAVPRKNQLDETFPAFALSQEKQLKIEFVFVFLHIKSSGVCF